MLDHGAALWAEFGQSGDFRSLLERTVPATFDRPLTQLIAERFGMDRLYDRLKDLIALVNANSQFTVYGLELEFYPHGAEMIVIQPVGIVADPGA